MSHRLDVVVPVHSEAAARAVAGALAVETESAPEGTSVIVRDAGSEIHVTITAQDARGLRAATNSYVRLVQSAAEVARVGHG